MISEMISEPHVIQILSIIAHDAYAFKSRMHSRAGEPRLSRNTLAEGQDFEEEQCVMQSASCEKNTCDTKLKGVSFDWALIVYKSSRPREGLRGGWCRVC